MDLSLAKLRHLQAVSEEKSVSRAAEMLGISQPALSRSIANVEERYGVRIFERGRTGAELTPAGVQIMEQVSALLRNVENLDQNLMLYGKGHLGSLAFGISPQLGSFLLKTIALEIIGENPSVKLQAVIRSAPDLSDALLANEIEFFICIDSQLSNNPEIEVELVCESDVAFYVSSRHPLAANESATLEQMRSYPFASPIHAIKNNKGRQDANLICDNYHILRDVVEDSDMISAFTPSFVQSKVAAGTLKLLKISDRPLQKRATFIATRRGRNPSPLAKRVMIAAREALSV
ncbi:MAG: LysR family transcriptional regulator [Novosphingobium sp.]